MIIATLGEEHHLEPPISFPFLWQHPASGNVYLRFENWLSRKEFRDIRMMTTSRINGVGELTQLTAEFPDDRAWSARFTKTLTLANA